MSFYDREYMKQAQLPDWLKEFADTFDKDAKSQTDNINAAINKKTSFDSVEAMVNDLQKRVGLDLIGKTASDKLPGGLADNMPSNVFDEKQLEQGIKHELEHTNDSKLAEEIAKDHLIEDPKYYDKLEEMEKKAKCILQLIKIAGEVEKYDKDLAKEIDKEIEDFFEKNIKGIKYDRSPEYFLERHNKKEQKKHKKDPLPYNEADDAIEIFVKFPNIKKFIDNICHSRAGRIELPAILTMLRDERPEEIDVDDENLKKYVKNKLDEEKKMFPEEKFKDDNVDYTIFIVEEDEGNKEVFSKPSKL